MSETPPFLLNPDHRAFVEGRSPRLNSAERSHYAHTMQMGVPTLLALLMMIGVLVYILLDAWEEQQIQAQLDLGGVDTSAQVVEVRSDGSGFQPYRLTYSFLPEALEGASQPVTNPVTNEQPISEQEYQRFAVGDEISVRYLPGDPAVSRFDSDYGLPVWVCFPYIIVPVLGAYLMKWYRSRDHWRMLRQLETEGRLLDGVVVSCRTGIPLPKDRVQIWLDYRFVSPTGQSLTDKGEGGMEEDDPLPEPGTPVKILYVDDQIYRVM